MRANSDHSVATSPARRGGRPFDDWLQRQLHEMYDSIALEPANAAYETRIFGPDRVKVQGRLVGLVRKY